MQLPSITPYFVHGYIFMERVLAAKFTKILFLEISPYVRYAMSFVSVQTSMCSYTRMVHSLSACPTMNCIFLASFASI